MQGLTFLAANPKQSPGPIECQLRSNGSAFIARVRQLYRQSPRRIANIAWHKLEGLLHDSEMMHLTDGDCECLYAIQKNRLIFYWSNQQERFQLPSESLRSLDFLVLHEDNYRLIADSLTGFNCTVDYPLFYDHAFVQPELRTSEYYVDDFRFDRDDDYTAVAEIITSTQAGYTVTPERVRHWTNDTAFDPSLWLLARDAESGQALGVGISAYHAPMQEADLDWFFVRPSVQGRGIGRALIAETIKRCQPKSEIIRLGGIADGFYEECGFKRGDKWFIIRKPS